MEKAPARDCVKMELKRIASDELSSKNEDDSGEDGENSTGTPGSEQRRKGRFTEREKAILFDIIRGDQRLLHEYLHQTKARTHGSKGWMHEIASRFNRRTEYPRKLDAVRHHLLLRRRKAMTERRPEFVMLAEHAKECQERSTCTKCLILDRYRVQHRLVSCGLSTCIICDWKLPCATEPIQDFDAVIAKAQEICCKKPTLVKLQTLPPSQSLSSITQGEKKRPLLQAFPLSMIQGQPHKRQQHIHESPKTEQETSMSPSAASFGSSFAGSPTFMAKRHYSASSLSSLGTNASHSSSAMSPLVESLSPSAKPSPINIFAIQGTTEEKKKKNETVSPSTIVSPDPTKSFDFELLAVVKQSLDRERRLREQPDHHESSYGK